MVKKEKNKKGKFDPVNMMARINAEHFTVQELLDIMDEVQKQPPDGHDWESRAFLLCKRYPGKPNRAQAADSRIVALANLIEKKVLPPPWNYRLSEEGAVMTADCVFEAATLEPLLYDKHEPYFDHESFVNRVLELSEAKTDS